MRVLFCILCALLSALRPGAVAASDVVEIVAQRPACEGPKCRSRDAIFFMHGIYSDDETFKNGQFDWPKELPQTIAGRPIDVYRINFKTLFWDWAKKNVTTLDELEEHLSAALFGSLEGPGRDGLLTDRTGRAVRPYRSVNFVAHSLGGNVAAALVHEVKSRYGHDRRARFGFVVALGTPANGSQIANLGGLFRWVIGLPNDPLLKSLELDNTFLRMLQRWRLAEDRKAQRFRCRPVHLYVAIEGKPLVSLGIIRHEVVSIENAKASVDGLAKEVHLFNDLDHSSIASPDSQSHEVYRWVGGIVEKELGRLNSWRSEPLCPPVRPLDW